MLEIVTNEYISAYLKLSYHILTDEVPCHTFCKRFSMPMAEIIRSSQFTLQNLSISSFYLLKYTKNSMISINSDDKASMVFSLIVISLILTNKIMDDNCYTLKVWSSSIDAHIPDFFTFKSLLQLELHFLSVLDFNLSYKDIMDVSFWNYVMRIAILCNIQYCIYDFMRCLTEYPKETGRTDQMPETVSGWTVPDMPISPSTPRSIQDVDLAFFTPLTTISNFEVTKEDHEENYTPTAIRSFFNDSSHDIFSW